MKQSEINKSIADSQAPPPISRLRYVFGLALLAGLHSACRISLFLRHRFIRRYPDYTTLVRFQRQYFKDTLRDVLSRRDIRVVPGNAHGNRKLIALIGLTAVCLLLFTAYLCKFNGPAAGYWDTYISTPALLMINRHVDFTLQDGTSLYHYTLPGRLPENLINRHCYGVASKDQRIGSALLAAPFALFFNVLGFRLLYALAAAAISLCVFYAAYCITRHGTASLLAALLATANAYIFSLHSLNPNIFGLMYVSLLLVFLLRPERNWFIIGLLFGALGGVRNIGILYGPALLYWLLSTSDHKKRDAILLFIGSCITIAPILYWNQCAFGKMLIHPSQYAAHEGFRPVFVHHVFGWTFLFNGMFNFPLYDKIVRTPYFAFPTFLTLPLTIIHSFGLVLISVITYGLYRSFQRNRALALFLLLWFLPMVVMFSLQENWSEMKTTFLLLFMNPLLLWMAIGICDISQRPLTGKRVFALAACYLVTMGGLIALRPVAFSVDARWYERFPRATKQTMSYVGDDLRTAPENPAELSRQKQRLTAAHPLPAAPHMPACSLTHLRHAVSTEAREETLKTVDYWKYIYGEDV